MSKTMLLRFHIVDKYVSLWEKQTFQNCRLSMISCIQCRATTPSYISRILCNIKKKSALAVLLLFLSVPHLLYNESTEVIPIHSSHNSDILGWSCPKPCSSSIIGESMEIIPMLVWSRPEPRSFSIIGLPRGCLSSYALSYESFWPYISAKETIRPCLRWR